MVKKRVKCISCPNLFWSKAFKDKETKKITALNNICQACLNKLRRQAVLQANEKRELKALGEDEDN